MQTFTISARTAQGRQRETDLTLGLALAHIDEFKERGATTVVIESEGRFLAEADLRQMWERRLAQGS